MVAELRIEPKQKRSQQTRIRICKAMLDLLGEKTFESITVEELVLHANCSTSSFYARFASKRSLLHHLQEQLIGLAVKQLSPTQQRNGSTQTSLRGLLGCALSRYIDFEIQHRTLLQSLRAQQLEDSRVRTRLEYFESRVGEWMRGMALQSLEWESKRSTHNQIDRGIWVLLSLAQALADPIRQSASGVPSANSVETVDLLIDATLPILTHSP